MIPGILYRLQGPAAHASSFPYLVVSDRQDFDQSPDLVTLASFHKAKGILKKKVREGLGLEFVIGRVRKMTGESAAKWFGDLRDAYAFCESSGAQFILSSGATSPHELVSGRSFDEILDELGIDHGRYWRQLELWLQEALSRKVVTAS